MPLPDGPVPAPSLSIGLATYHPDDTAHDLYARADRAMYAAKRAGGMRHVCA